MYFSMALFNVYVRSVEFNFLRFAKIMKKKIQFFVVFVLEFFPFLI